MLPAALPIGYAMTMGNDNLWAPWRMHYIQQIEQDRPGGTPPAPGKGCFLCDAAACEPGSQEARQRLVLLRDQRGIILLNRFPYTSGHLLAAPAAHVADLPDMTPPLRAHLMELVTLAQEVVRLTYAPQGFNVGINLGRCAGAGLPGHLHVHIVPRWNGDTNFMASLGQVRVIPQALDESWQQMRDSLDQLRNSPTAAAPEEGA